MMPTDQGQPIKKCWPASKGPGMWFVTYGSEVGLWEAWAWRGQQEPPKSFMQDGYRFRLAGGPQ